MSVVKQTPEECAYICDFIVCVLSTHISILNALQERRKEREKQAAANQETFQQQAESVEKRTWREFWDSESPGLLLYACLHGTVDIVKYFVTKHVSPTTRYHCIKSSSPVTSCASMMLIFGVCTCTCNLTHVCTTHKKLGVTCTLELS